MPASKIDWRKLWKEFDEWAEGKRIYPRWYGPRGQKVMIRKLVETQLRGKK